MLLLTVNRVAAVLDAAEVEQGLLSDGGVGQCGALTLDPSGLVVGHVSPLAEAGVCVDVSRGAVPAVAVGVTEHDAGLVAHVGNVAVKASHAIGALYVERNQ